MLKAMMQDRMSPCLGEWGWWGHKHRSGREAEQRGRAGVKAVGGAMRGVA